MDNNYIGAINCLEDNGFDIKTFSKEVLIGAIKQNDVSAIRYIISHIGKSDYFDEFNIAIYYCDTEIIELLLRNDTGMICTYAQEYSTELYARILLSPNSLEILAMLLDNVQYIEKDVGRYIIQKAIIYDRLDIVKYILGHNFNIEWCTSDEDTKHDILPFAISHNTTEIAELLIENGINIHGKSNLEYALQTAVEMNNFKLVKLLVDHGANIHVWADTIMKLAIKHEYLDIIEYLIKIGINISDTDMALCAAVQYDTIDALKLLIDNGANVHINNENVLHTAIRLKRYNMIKILIEDFGANIHTGIYNALYYASYTGDINIVKLIVGYGAVISANNYNAVRVALEENDNGIDIVKYLILEDDKLS